jgi:hypothetical protein
MVTEVPPSVSVSIPALHETIRFYQSLTMHMSAYYMTVSDIVWERAWALNSRDTMIVPSAVTGYGALLISPAVFFGGLNDCVALEHSNEHISTSSSTCLPLRLASSSKRGLLSIRTPFSWHVLHIDLNVNLLGLFPVIDDLTLHDEGVVLDIIA